MGRAGIQQNSRSYKTTVPASLGESWTRLADKYMSVIVHVNKTNYRETTPLSTIETDLLYTPLSAVHSPAMLLPLLPCSSILLCTA